MEYIKLNTRGILRGSLCQSDDVVQLVWIKLLCFMSETKQRNGRFEYAPGKPYDLDFIALNIGTSRVVLEACLREFEADVNPEDEQPRIKFDNDGTLILVNWERYQRKPEKVVAKEIAIAKAKETRHRQQTATDALIRTVNRLNQGLAARRYELTPDNKILDTKTGEVKELGKVTE